ncbi:esterase-like activity of phytase family protein [Kordiimonas aquimaris]|uniref:esterase-like activity of phytase family protein n=1 Tax=Kordiimonas aquimaris TaxID=707591 RepID=UPI0021D0C100|nr:esterase-like activity of phytase family protein [Kordiimonas aquimaris]
MAKKWLVAGAAIVLIAVVAAAQISGHPRLSGAAISIEIMAKPLLLNPEDAQQNNLGEMRYAGGWVLSSTAESFGGFSGLMVDAEAQRLLAISDKGEWWQAAFDARSNTPPSDSVMLPYENDADAVSKIDLDAESIVSFGSDILVSFEQRHRLEQVSVPGEEARLSSFMLDVTFDGVSNNGGMEAIAVLANGQLLAFAERGLDQLGRLKAWLSNGAVTEALSFKPPVNFAPTDAATLPNGDVLVLLRQYSAIDGVAIKVHHIRRGDILPGAILEGVEVLHITPKLSVDNMEGLDVVALDEDTVRLVMISDDNFNPLQRILLMMFDYIYQ